MTGYKEDSQKTNTQFQNPNAFKNAVTNSKSI
jgi:hypothetical protein